MKHITTISCAFPTLFSSFHLLFSLLILHSASCLLSVTALWCFHFPPLVYIFAYLSAPLIAHHHSFSGSYKVLRQSERQPSCSPSTTQKLTRWPCLCSSRCPSKLGKLAATRILKTWASFQLLTISLSSFFSPCWATKSLSMKKIGFLS